MSHEEGAAAAAEFMLRFATSEFKGVVGFSRGLRSYHHAPLYIFVSDKESECLVAKLPKLQLRDQSCLLRPNTHFLYLRKVYMLYETTE